MIGVVVVTFNRKQLLKRCLESIVCQTYQVDKIIIVDNASTDGTKEWLEGWAAANIPDGVLVFLDENIGGAGGFEAGMRVAFENNLDWVWMMDDDAEPHVDALEKLVLVATKPQNIYCSLATCGEETSWIVGLVELTPLRSTLRRVGLRKDVPVVAEVDSMPFLGFFIHRELIEIIGLPDADFFIAADDLEYCIRAKHAGAQIIVAGNSLITHPKSRPYVISLPGRILHGLELPPWKRYYDTRNRLFIARRHYSVGLYMQVILATFIRMITTLIREQKRCAQLRAYLAGIIDGLLGRGGKRHEKWRLGA